jgi:hypothetical protein
MHNYCTLFDCNYLIRGLALHSSLVRHSGAARLFILCLDTPTQEALSALSLPRVELVPLSVLEDWDRELKASRSNRSAVEFYFTCKSALMRYLLARDPGIERLTYLDSDLFFFSDPGVVEEQVKGSTVALTPHRFPTRLAFMRRSGDFNAGWVGVGASAEGRRFLEWWRESCIEWCRSIFEETRFGDQKYLDRVPELFRDVVSIDHPGVNAAPWNIGELLVEIRDGGVIVNGQPLVAFHFHGMKRVFHPLYDSGLFMYRGKLTDAVRRGVFRPYLRELARIEERLADLPGRVRASIGPAFELKAGSGWRDRLRVLARIVATRTALLAR